jgi:hypothetical protein
MAAPDKPRDTSATLSGLMHADGLASRRGAALHPLRASAGTSGTEAPVHVLASAASRCTGLRRRRSAEPADCGAGQTHQYDGGLEWKWLKVDQARYSKFGDVEKSVRSSVESIDSP